MPIPTDIRLLVFDLDGTLIDSQRDLAFSINAMLRHYHRPEQPEKVIASYIGNGAAMLVRRALGTPEPSADGKTDAHDEAFVADALAVFIAAYDRHKLDTTTLYPGALESIAAIRAAHPRIQMAVLTNKPVRASRAICAHFGLDQYFFQIYGGNSFHTKKPDPQGLLALIAEAAVTPQQTVMIGDSDVDILTARNAGACAIGCSFGLAPHTLAAAEPDLTVSRAADWPSALGLT